MEIVLGEKALGGFGEVRFAHSHACRATEYLCPAVVRANMNLGAFWDNQLVSEHI